MAVWPYEPSAQITETVVSRGEVMQAASAEMRLSFHASRRHFSMTFPLENDRYMQALETIKAEPLATVQVPIWTERQDVAVASADTEIACDVNASFAVGGTVIVWSSETNFTTATISAVGGSSITLAGALGADHPSGVLMPLGTGYPRKWGAQRRGRDITDISAMFEVFDLPDLDPGAEIPEFPNISGVPTIVSGFAVINPANVNITQAAEWFESEFLTPQPVPQRTVIEAYQVVSMHMIGRRQRHALLELLHALRGMQGPFWAVEPGGNINVIASTSTTITVAKIAGTAADLVGRLFQTDSGTVREVTAAVDSGANQVMTIAALSEATEQVYFLRLYRADTDEVRISHLTRSDSARAEFPCLEVAA